MFFVAFMSIGALSELKAQDMALKTNLLYDATSTINLGYEVALNNKTTLDIWVNYNPWTLGHKWVGINVGNDNNLTNDLVDQREMKLKHFMVQPEVRWWLCEKFNGHFFGAHLHGGLFNVGALTLPFGWGRYKDGSGEYYGQYPVKMSKNFGTTENPDWRDVSGVRYGEGTTRYSGLVSKFGEAEADREIHYSNADRDGIYVNSFEGWFIGAGVSYGYHWILAPRFSLEFTIGVGYAYLNYEKSRCTDCKQSLEDAVTHYFGPTRAGLSLIYMLR